MFLKSEVVQPQLAFAREMVTGSSPEFFSVTVPLPFSLVENVTQVKCFRRCDDTTCSLPVLDVSCCWVLFGWSGFVLSLLLSPTSVAVPSPTVGFGREVDFIALACLICQNQYQVLINARTGFDESTVATDFNFCFILFQLHFRQCVRFILWLFTHLLVESQPRRQRVQLLR